MARKNTKPTKRKTVRKNPYRAKRRSRPFFKEVILGKLLPATLLCSIIVGGVWFYTSGTYDTIKQQTTDLFIAETAKMGFIVENLTVKGRKNLSPESVTAILNIKRGDPLFIFNPDTMRQQIESLSWVKHVRIERRFPNTVHIEITEREPLALWQHNKEMAIIDDDGIVLTREHLGQYGELLQVIGKEANIQATQLIQHLELTPEIKKRVKSATWIGNRRWDLTLKNGIIIKLPEKDEVQALQTLAKMENQDKILDRAIVLVDLRISDKIIIRPETGANTQIERKRFDDEPSSGKDKAI